MSRRRWLGRLLAVALAAVITSPVLGADARALSERQVGLTARPVVDRSLHAAPEPCRSWPSGLPVGALPPATPAWCGPLAQGDPTFVEGPNAWLDEFDHGLEHAALGDGYRVFEREGPSINKALHFRHNDHWMVDVNGVDQDGGAPWNFGGALMRPDRAFRFQSGTLVVEVDVAAGIAEYGGAAWPEIVVTTAPAPSGIVDDGYAYGVFKGHWTVGCRLQSSRQPICALYDDTGRGAGSGGRTFEISSFQHEGAQAFGGGPFGTELEQAWRVCRGTDPDTECRDRFRWELSRDTLVLYVNGVKYMEHRGLPQTKQLPDALLTGDVYVYLASWIYKPDAEVMRFHWDRLAINPDSGALTPRAATQPRPSASHPAHGGAPVEPPAADAGAPEVAAPAGAPAGTTAVTFDDRPGQDQVLDGEYPTGVIDWGTGRWYLSGPFAGFASKSVSFNGAGVSSATLAFRAPRQLVQLMATNGGSGPSTVTLRCDGLPTVTASVKSGEVTTIETGWTGACSAVTIASSNGWDTNFDDFVLRAPNDSEGGAAAAVGHGSQAR